MAMRSLFFVLLLACTVGVWAQNSNPSDADKSSSGRSSPSDSQAPDSQSSTSKAAQAPMPGPNAAAPRSDRIDAAALGDEGGSSSSKDTAIDLSPPPGDDKAHPHSAEILTDAEAAYTNGDVNEFHPWDPHKAAKDIEVGDFYFKRKNYIAAEDRYREALFYKQDDAMATFKLAVCLEKMARPGEARTEYEKYLKILPYGPQAPDAKKALERLKNSSANANLSK